MCTASVGRRDEGNVVVAQLLDSKAPSNFINSECILYLVDRSTAGHIWKVTVAPYTCRTSSWMVLETQDVGVPFKVKVFSSCGQNDRSL